MAVQSHLDNLQKESEGRFADQYDSYQLTEIPKLPIFKKLFISFFEIRKR